MITSLLDTMRVVGPPLATTSGYAVMVSSMWGSIIRKMDRDGGEAHITRQMALRRCMIRSTTMRCD